VTCNWNPKGFSPRGRVSAGIHNGLIRGIRESISKTKGYFLLVLQAKAYARVTTSTRFWGARQAVDARNSCIVGRLNQIAALPWEEEPDGNRLVKELEDLPLMLKLGVNAKTGNLEVHEVLGEVDPLETQEQTSPAGTDSDISDDWDVVHGFGLEE